MEPPLLMMWRCLFLRCLVHNTEWWQGQLKSISGLTTHPQPKTWKNVTQLLQTLFPHIYGSLWYLLELKNAPSRWGSRWNDTFKASFFFTAVTNYPQRRWWSKILVMLHYIFWTESKRSICRLMITLPLLLVQPLKDFAGEEIWNGACRDKCRWDSE